MDLSSRTPGAWPLISSNKSRTAGLLSVLKLRPPLLARSKTHVRQQNFHEDGCDESWQSLNFENMRCSMIEGFVLLHVAAR